MDIDSDLEHLKLRKKAEGLMETSFINWFPAKYIEYFKLYNIFLELRKTLTDIDQNINKHIDGFKLNTSKSSSLYIFFIFFIEFLTMIQQNFLRIFIAYRLRRVSGYRIFKNLYSLASIFFPRKPVIYSEQPIFLKRTTQAMPINQDNDS